MNNKKLIIKRLLRHKLAFWGIIVLFILYFLLIFAELIAPYGMDSEDRANSYNPPTKIHFYDKKTGFHIIPFVYKYRYEFDEYYRRVFKEDKSRIYKIKFFVRGDKYKLWGIIPLDFHLFGVEEGARIYLFGADSRGRDLFSRILYGSRVSLTIGFIGVFISMFIGVIVGGISGYFGGIVDSLIMRICEMVMLIPGFYLLLALRAAFPPQMSSVEIYFIIVFILSFIGWASLARVVRGMVKSVSSADFVIAAKVMGQNDFKIIFKHIIPQISSYLIVSATLSIPAYIIGESGLSLIGLGIQDPYASWGNLLSEAMNIAEIKFHPWILIPGFFIFVTVMAYNFLGDGLRDALDPKSGR